MLTSVKSSKDSNLFYLIQYQNVRFLKAMILILSLMLLSKPTLAQQQPLTQLQMNLALPNSVSQAQTSYFLEHPLERLTLYLARSTNLIGDNDIPELVQSLEKTQTVPDRFKKDWHQLRNLSYYLLKIKDNKYFFPVGYEFESGHGFIKSSDSDAAYKDGTRELFKLVASYFGQGGQINFKMGQDSPSQMKDASGQLWLMTQEWVRDTDFTGTTDPDGWETVSKPMFVPDELRPLASFVIALSKSPYGQEAEFTGGHQTFNLIPNGEKADSKLVGLAAANFFLLQAQFARSIFDVLQVKRFGGHGNYFLRPLIFDHSELLKDLTHINVDQFSIEDFNKLLFEKHLLTEYKAHIGYSANYTDEDRAELLKATPNQIRRNTKNWKYHDVQIRFNAEKPERTLVEVRINDYKSNDLGQTTFRATYLYQKLLTLAFDMAKNKQIWKLDLPFRMANETIDEYWARLKLHPSSNPNYLFQTLGLDQNDRVVFKRQPQYSYKSQFKAGEKISFGFEMETQADKIVELIIPNDPKLHTEWREWTTKRKLKYLKAVLGQDIALDDFIYSKDGYTNLTTKFSVDIHKFPFMDAEIHIEESGNLEIKSNGKAVYNLELLKAQMLKVKKVFADEYFGAHMHIFVPDELLVQLRDPNHADHFAAFIDRLSFYLQIKDYTDEKNDNKPTHALDSWSLDRWSEQDILKLYQYLIGEGTIDNRSIKHRNIGIRKVKGGLDFELRTVGDDVEFGSKILELVQKAILKPQELGDIKYLSSHHLFHEFREPTKKDNPSDYYLAKKLKERFPNMTAQQLDLAHKLQFEMYKPSMGDYMAFGADLFAPEVADPKDLNLNSARANFESNLVIPLQKFEQLNYLSQEQVESIQAHRNNYLDQMFRLILSMEEKIKDNPLANKALFSEPNYLYLADYLRRSESADRPNFKSYDKKYSSRERARQKMVLENLVYAARKITLDFITESQLDQIFFETVREPVRVLRSNLQSQNRFYKSPSLNKKASPSYRPLVHQTRSAALQCGVLFN